MRKVLFFLLFMPCLSKGQESLYPFMREAAHGYQDFTGAAVITPTAPLYTTPDTGSTVLKNLQFNAPVEVIGTGWDGTAQIFWYKVIHGKTPGYLRLQHLAQNSFAHGRKKYFIQMSSGYNTQDSMRIITWDTRKEAFTDTLRYPGISAENYYTVQIQGTDLKDTEALLKVHIIMPYCGGGQNDLYFADANGSFCFLFSAFNGGDIGYTHSTAAWLPVKTASGKTQLMPVDHPGSALSIPFSPKIKVPPNELIVLRSVEVETELDEDQEPVRDASGSEVIYIPRDVTEYYRWNGRALQKVLTEESIKNENK